MRRHHGARARPTPPHEIGCEWLIIPVTMATLEQSSSELGTMKDEVGTVTAARRRVVVVALIMAAVLLLSGWVLIRAVDPDGSGASGAGFTYRGDFYALSSAEVRLDRLGDVLDEQVPFQDTTTEVRRILGVSPDVAVAALLYLPDANSGQGEQAWLLLSPEADLAADPFSDRELSSVVQPQP